MYYPTPELRRYWRKLMHDLYYEESALMSNPRKLKSPKSSNGSAKLVLRDGVVVNVARWKARRQRAKLAQLARGRHIEATIRAAVRAKVARLGPKLIRE